MILSFDQLANYRGLVSLVDGSFDPLHPGHLAYFRTARSLGYPLLCNLCPDAETARKHPVLLPAPERAQILDALDILTYVHVSAHPTIGILRQLRPKYYVKGEDWIDRLPKDIGQVCDELGIKIIYTATKTRSSSEIVQSLQPDVEVFEALVQRQVPASEPWAPVTDYSYEARKAIEGPHAQLIKEAFAPRLVMDAGCGFGYLARMLRELGLSVTSVDKEDYGDDQSLYGYDLSDWWRHDLFAPRSFDLVICREVLEHLTIRDIAKAVRTLCMHSGRYVYLTTRFHQSRHFLDFATSDDLDPTHISIMPKAWLRHLFVLEGFRARPDLEERLDWRNLGRCLVYERV